VAVAILEEPLVRLGIHGRTLARIFFQAASAEPFWGGAPCACEPTSPTA
jgi:hypothetical protein